MKYLPINSEFNQIHYPETIGKFFDSPPDYAQVEEMPDYKVIVEFDNDPLHPRKEWDNMGTISDCLRRYTLGEDSFTNVFDFLAYELAGLDEDQKIKVCDKFFEVCELDEDDPDDMGAIWNKVNEKYFVLPIHAYIHSGMTISTGSFSCPWDSGFAGYIYVSKEKAKEWMGWKRLTKSRIAKIYTYLEGEIETLDAYLTGQVFGYRVVEVDEDGEEVDDVDSCWGFYDEKYCREEGERVIEHLKESFRKKILKNS